jgi:hypothetical protein
MLSLTGSHPGHLIRFITPLEVCEVKVTAGHGGASTDQQLSSNLEPTSVREQLIHVMWGIGMDIFLKGGT